VPGFVGKPTDAKKLGRHVAAELLDLAAGALVADPALRDQIRRPEWEMS
jgi:hypothetical protein